MVLPHEVTNIVAVGNVADSIDLASVAICLEAAEYNPDRFAAVVWRINDPHCCFLIFESGTIVMLGAKTIGDTEDAYLNHLVPALDECGTTIGVPTIEFRNFSALKDYETTFDLAQVWACLAAENCEWDPDIFPGLIYRASVGADEICHLIFESGKVVCVGAETILNLTQAYADLTTALTGCGLLV